MSHEQYVESFHKLKEEQRRRQGQGQGQVKAEGSVGTGGGGGGGGGEASGGVQRQEVHLMSEAEYLEYCQR